MLPLEGITIGGLRKAFSGGLDPLGKYLVGLTLRGILLGEEGRKRTIGFHLGPNQERGLEGEPKH